MSSKVQQSVCSDCVTYAKSRIKFNTFNTFNNVAAARCCVTKSAVSQHVRALEDELGCKLLIRTSHGIMLTESGESLLPRAKEIHLQSCNRKGFLIAKLKINILYYLCLILKMLILILNYQKNNIYNKKIPASTPFIYKG